jgi:hypothetical protein
VYCSISNARCIVAERMVRFGWPVKTTKYSVPPSERDTYHPPRYYEEHHASSVPFPSTSTSTVPTNTTTNTIQTTHFLSLPVSRKHQEQQVDPPQSLSMFDVRTYQAGLDRQKEQGTSSPREKSLPPTPSSSNEDVHGNAIRRTDSPVGNESWSYRPSSQVPQPTTASPPARPSPSQAKIALAQAALAIGLPHSMPQASASSSRSDVTSMGFVTIPHLVDIQSRRSRLPACDEQRAFTNYHETSGEMMTITHMLVLKDQEDLAGSPLVLLTLSIQMEREMGTLWRIFLHT